MIEAKIFKNKITELNERFSFIMTEYINYYIENGLSFDNNNEYYQPYMRLITNLEKLNSELFRINNQLDKNINILNKDIHNLKQNISKQININTNDDIITLQKMQNDTSITYTKTNINIFNYLLGVILGIYILRNL